MRRRPGFTLLEVMIAVAILAISLTAIYSSQAGAIKMSHKARKMGTAALMARCKMGEVEEQIAAEGLPAIFDSGHDECCEDAEMEGFRCAWEINPVVMPDSMFNPEEDDDEPFSDGPGGDDGPSAADSAAGLSPQELMSGGSVDGLAATAMGYVYPVLKPSFESQIRRVTVTVKWKEGKKDHSFDVTQYVVSGQPVPLELQEEQVDGPAGPAPQ